MWKSIVFISLIGVFVFNSGFPAKPMFYAMSDDMKESLTVGESKEKLPDETSSSMNAILGIPIVVFLLFSLKLFPTNTKEENIQPFEFY